jgi:hypothetical protein
MQRDRYGLAFTVERVADGDAFCREDAAAYARKELEKAGIPSHGVVIEAYESHAGWLVFCTVENESDVYIFFDSSDDFLDAILAHGTKGLLLRGWKSPGGYTARVSGPQDRVAKYISLLREYGRPFEAPAGYARHLEEQRSVYTEGTVN